MNVSLIRPSIQELPPCPLIREHISCSFSSGGSTSRTIDISSAAALVVCSRSATGLFASCHRIIAYNPIVITDAQLLRHTSKRCPPLPQQYGPDRPLRTPTRLNEAKPAPPPHLDESKCSTPPHPPLTDKGRAGASRFSVPLRRPKYAAIPPNQALAPREEGRKIRVHG